MASRRPTRLTPKDKITTAYPNELAADFKTGDLVLYDNDGKEKTTIPAKLSLETTGTGNAVSEVTVDGYRVKVTKSNIDTTHETIPVVPDTTSKNSTSYGSKINVVDAISRDKNGHVLNVNTSTVTLPSEQTTITGNAGTATKLETARDISISGAVTGTATSFDGSMNIDIKTTSVDGTKITGTIPLASIPKGAQERLVPVANNDAKLALTTEDVQTGDVIKLQDTGIMYYVVDESKLGTEAAFEVFTAGAASSVDWTGVQNKPDFKAVATSGSYNDLSDTPTIPEIPNLSKGVTTGEGNAVTDISVNGHKITLTKGTTFLTKHPDITKTPDDTTVTSPGFGENVTAVDAVVRDTNGHVTKVTKKTITLPTETVLSKKESGNGNAVTGIEVSNHEITLTKGTTFLTEHPDIANTDDTTSIATPDHGATFDVVDGITRDTNGHVTTINTKTVTMPAETQLSKAKTVGTGNAVTEVAVNNHKITLTKGATFLTSETTLSKEESGAGNAITGIEVDNHKITISKDSTFLTEHPSINKTKDTTSTASPNYGASFTTIDGITRDTNGHVTTINTKTVTMPSEQTTITGNAGTATKLKSARTIGISGAITGTATSFDGSADINIKTTSVDGTKITGTIPLASIPKGAQERFVPVANNTAKLALTTEDVQNGDVIKLQDTGIMYYVIDESKLGTEDAFSVFTAGAASSVEWSGIQNKPDFKTVATSGSYNDLSDKPTIPTIPDISKGVTTGSGNAVTDISVNGHKITLTKGTTFLTKHPDITKTTDTKSAAEDPGYNGTFEVVDKITRDANGHVTTIATKTVSMPDAQDLSTLMPKSGGTFSGNISGQNMSATNLQTTNATNIGSKPESIAVIDSSGWIHKRTPEEVLEDISAAKSNHTHSQSDIMKFVTKTITKGTDLNSLTYSGIYGANLDHNCTSIPSIAQFKSFSLIIISDPDGNIIQKLINSFGQTAIRSYMTKYKIWSDWYYTVKENLYKAIIGTSWSGSNAPYTQVININNINSTDTPIIDIDLSSIAYSNKSKIMEDYAKIYRITTSNSSIMVYADEKTTNDIPIQLKVVE